MLARPSITLLTALLIALLLPSCATTSKEARASRGSGAGGLWESLEQSRRAKEARMARDGDRGERLEAQIARGRAQLPEETAKKIEAWWRQFLEGDARWPESRRQWHALGPEAREILAENLMISVVRSFETNRGWLYKRARAEIFYLPEESAPYLVSALAGRHGDDVVRARCIELLSDIGKKALPSIGSAYGEVDDPAARADLVKAVAAMGEYGAPDSIPFLSEAALEGDDFRVRISAVKGLGLTRHAKAREPLIRCLGDEDLSVRKFAAASLGAFRGDAVTEALIEAMASSERAWAGGRGRESEVLVNCRASLKRMTGRDFKRAEDWKTWWRTQRG